MTAGLGEADLARMQRSGIVALSDEEGLELFDQAIGAGLPLALAAPLDRSALRAQAAAGVLPAPLRDLVRAPARRPASGSSLAVKLAAVSEAERRQLVLDLVRSEVAAVLGHASAAAIEPEKAFKDLGFDSLAAVELRNRLKAATGLRLGATVVFDHPSASALAEHLLLEATAAGGARKAVARAQSSEEPIAIVGAACRFPGGVSSPDGLWQLVADGRDGIGEFPTDRGWDLERLFHPDPDHPSTSYVSEAGFLEGADRFDADFFGIGPREALVSDPQQRLLLEASWEALEDAGIDPASLRGSQAGVFAGISSQDYVSGLSAADGGPEGYRLTGSSASVISGRISYTLGLEGPAITIDTACSSSLVAMHLASQALRGGECSLALAGGVTVLATPSLFAEFSRQRVLAPDGRCKSFAQAADGAGFSEGVGVVALERLSDAQRNGHRVLALIRGSAVNQDGASNGLSAPNGPSQERVIRQALANARLSPQDVDAVEAHGTGTTLGDPIEAGALSATYGQERERPLKLGSIKSNIGHAQAAAGVAGVIKMVMALRAQTLPKTLHVDAPSANVDWETGKVELLTEAEPWESNGAARRAGISSFGISGTNAHLIVEEAPEPAAEQGAAEPDSPQALSGGPIPLLLSAKSEDALRAGAGRLASQLKDNPELDPLDVAYSLATTRSAFERRAVILGADAKELLGGLTALQRGEDSPALVGGRAASASKLAFLFSGHGSQWSQMALGLLECSPAFAAHIAECEGALSPLVDWSLKEVLRDPEGAWLDRLEVIQPALFAVMISLAKLWRGLGVEPQAVVGHSLGEIAAAHVAGGLSLDDAAKLGVVRARLITKLVGQGSLASIALGAERLEARLGRWGERSRSPRSTAPPPRSWPAAARRWRSSWPSVRQRRPASTACPPRWPPTQPKSRCCARS